jgi:hypothetical protein
VQVTPELAKEWLEQNTGNFRSVDKSRVENYAAEMAAGRWDLNGETIKFNGNVLIDGQHRLLAAIKAGVAFESVVINGLSSDAMHIDRGKPRSIGQWLAHAKIKNAHNVAAIARMCVAHDKGLWHNRSWGYGLMTDSEVIDFANKYNEQINASLWTSSKPGNGVSSSILTAVLFLGSGKQDASQNETAEWFREKLISGTDLAETDAVLHLRNRFASNSGTFKLTAFMVRCLTTLAWNKTVAGDACTSNGLRIRMTGPAAQKVPMSVLVAE